MWIKREAQIISRCGLTVSIQIVHIKLQPEWQEVSQWLSVCLSLSLSLSLWENYIRALLVRYYSIQNGYIYNIIIHPRVHMDRVSKGISNLV